jgi:parallel beta-helix repeat protein
MIDDPALTADRAHVQASSPCLEAGDPDDDYTGQTDIDGEPRVVNEQVDIGADEFRDTDEDGLPDWWEQLYFGSPTASDPLADEDEDGVPNLEEYGLFRNPFRPPRTFYVKVSGNDDWDGLASEWDGEHGPKATIQSAIDATERHEGDAVAVADGTYTGAGNTDLDYKGKAIAVRSTNGPKNCVIDCEGQVRGVSFYSGETPGSVLQGFTIRNGYVEDFPGGAGVYCRYANPTISNCTIAGNTTSWDGSGLSCYYSSPLITNCTIAGNRNTASGNWRGGGGVYCYESHPTLSNCTITGNTADRHGGGVYCSYSNPLISNCTITLNTAGQRGGGVYCSASSPALTNCILWGNLAGYLGPQVYGATLTVMYSCIEDGWPGDGNIGDNPLIVDSAGPDGTPGTADDNLRLSLGSPCIDAADNTVVTSPTDLDGNHRFVDDPRSVDTGSGTPPIVDMGAYEFRPGDCAYDGDVDHADYADFESCLAGPGAMPPPDCECFDLDGRGYVDLADFATFQNVSTGP